MNRPKICIVSAKLTTFYDDMFKHIHNITATYDNIECETLLLEFPIKEHWLLPIDWYIQYFEDIRKRIRQMNAQLYIMDSTIYCFMITWIYVVSVVHGEDSTAFLDFFFEIPYVVLWMEIIRNNQMIGITLHSAFPNLINDFFMNAMYVYTANMSTIQFLETLSFHKYRLIGYGLDIQTPDLSSHKNHPKEIDILIYGLQTVYRDGVYKKMCEMYPTMNIQYVPSIYKIELTTKLLQSACVLHIPYDKDCHQFPFAKCVYLAVNYIPFIVYQCNEYKHFNAFNTIRHIFVNENMSNVADCIIQSQNIDNLNRVHKIFMSNFGVHNVLNHVFDYFLHRFHIIITGNTCSSHRYYDDMVLTFSDPTSQIINIHNVKEYVTGTVFHKHDCFMINMAVLYHLIYVYNIRLYEHNINYIIICGENIYFNQTIQDYIFVGWESIPNNSLTTGILYEYFKKSLVTTCQNKITIDFFKNHNISHTFQSIAYIDTDWCNQDLPTTKDIDILYYGGILHYPRRVTVCHSITLSRSKFIIAHNSQWNDDLNKLLVRAKCVLHINSMNNCYHIPFAKIMRPLVFNALCIIERTKEMEEFEWREYLHLVDLPPYVETACIDICVALDISAIHSMMNESFLLIYMNVPICFTNLEVLEKIPIVFTNINDIGLFQDCKDWIRIEGDHNGNVLFTSSSAKYIKRPCMKNPNASPSVCNWIDNMMKNVQHVFEDDAYVHMKKKIHKDFSIQSKKKHLIHTINDILSKEK